MRNELYFQWGVSTLFGWGVYGLNLMRHWPVVAGAPAFCMGEIRLESLAGMDPLALRVLADPLVQSDQLRLRRAASADAGPVDGVALHALGNQFSGSPLPRDGGLTGRATCGAIFFEDTNLPNAADVARDYDLIVAGSRWCEEVLRGNGVTNVATVVQGVDLSHFHPAPRSGALEGRFAVFSGGKLEHRKAQDLVLLGFRAFAARHPEAVLATSWHSPWPHCALTVNGNPDIAPVGFSADGRADVAGWARANGLREEQFIDLGSIPNHLMARVLREMDAAVFPNRCEGGTNLVAMECMACGVPTILADNTGQKDLVATGAPYALSRQSAVISPTGLGTEGWGESDVDEIAEALESIWAAREEARHRGLAGARAMTGWTWHNQIGQLHAALAPICS